MNYIPSNFDLTKPKKNTCVFNVHMCPAFVFSVQVPSPKPWDSMAIPLAGVEELRLAPDFFRPSWQCGLSWEFMPGSFLTFLWKCGSSVCVWWCSFRGRLGDDLMPKKCHLATEVVVDWQTASVKNQVFPRNRTHNFQAASRCTSIASRCTSITELAKAFPYLLLWL